MKKTPTSKQAWHKAETQCAEALAKLYINHTGNQADAMNLVVESWSKTMKRLNASVQSQKFGGKTFDSLTVDEKLQLNFSSPHETLACFARTVRFAAAVAQKVS